MASRSYDFTLAAANSVQRLDVMASRVKVQSATGLVEVRTPEGDVYQLLAGQGFTLPKGQQFRELLIVNKSGALNTGTVFVGDEAFEDSRITGEVLIVDGSVAKTLQGRSFFNSITRVADAANVGVVHVLANGKTIAVRRLIVQSTVAGDAVLGTEASAGTAVAASGGSRNKLVSGAVSTALTASGLQAGAIPTAGEVPGWQATARFYMAANTPYVVNFDPPLVLSGTQGLALNGQAINRDISALIDFDEIA